METNYISAPKNFEHMEGNSVDFKKTFDLNGTNNDEMLRLYLRKAGLSDEIECLTPEQRRAFIYDIIKSNKMPGYWKPSTIRTSSFMQQPPSVRPPPPPIQKEMHSPLTEVRDDPFTPTLHYATMSTSSSSSSLKSMSRNSPLMSNRFVQPVCSPASPTSILKSKKGMRYEISGPVNFTHISGDMTRDMTKNAFDLSLTMNDNVLKKYLIERGIKDEEISGIRKQDLIRNIVQSRFTWMPPNHKQNNISDVQFAGNANEENISPSQTPSPNSTPSPLSEKYPPTYVKTSAATFKPAEPIASITNFDLITSRFPDSSLFPSPDSLFNNFIEQTNPPMTASMTKSIRPAPPPRKSKPNKDNVPPPPPRLMIATPNNVTTIWHAKTKPEDYYESVAEAKIRCQQPSINDDENLYLYTATELKTKSQNNVKNSHYLEEFANLPSHRQSSILNENTNQSNIPEPSHISCSSDSVTPPPPPPPPPPIMQLNISTVLESPLPPPMPQSSTYNGPPPPPPMIVKPKFSVAAPSSSNDLGDPRDAFLESIRKGVALKKVNQKSATISGSKIKSERKPPVTDFMSELKMGINLRKVKISIDEPNGSNETEA